MADEADRRTAQRTAQPLRMDCSVLHDTAWYPATLDRWKHDERGWVGYVWWSEGPGLTHVEWIPAHRLRAAT